MGKRYWERRNKCQSLLKDVLSILRSINEHLLANSFNRFQIRFEWNSRTGRERELMTIDKGRFLQLQIIRKDHERFQIDNILDVIGEQGLQRFLIPISLIILPQKDGKVSINPL